MDRFVVGEASHGINSEATLALSLRDGPEMGCVTAVTSGWIGSSWAGPRHGINSEATLALSLRDGSEMGNAIAVGSTSLIAAERPGIGLQGSPEGARQM